MADKPILFSAPMIRALLEGRKTQTRNIVPSIHVPRWASRLTLIVEGVKVERLQDICGDDCVSEGIPPNSGAPMGVYLEKRTENVEAERRWQVGMRQQFRDLWNSINKKPPHPVGS